jgi:hypothetical protein
MADDSKICRNFTTRIIIYASSLSVHSFPENISCVHTVGSDVEIYLREPFGYAQGGGDCYAKL